MLHRFFVLLFLTLLFASHASAQPIDTKKLDSLFHELDINNEAMGSVAILKNGHLIYQNAIGYRAISDNGKLPANAATKYRAASISKMLTATLIFQLIEENKLSLHTAIDTWFPAIPNASNITIGQLLSHRSGLHNLITEDTWIVDHKTEDELLALISRSPQDFAPGTKAAYSNTNYWLLGFIAERICKKSYSQLLQEKIVGPLKLKDTYYGDTTDLLKNESHSYYYYGDKWLQYPETDISLLCGAGAVISTPTDLCRFMTGLFDGKLISHESLGRMISSSEPMGMGMTQIPFYAHAGYGHTGHIDGFYSAAAYFPADSLAVTYCSNGHRYGLNDILIGILSIYYCTSYSIPDFKSMTANAEGLTKYTGTYSSNKFPLKITVTAVGETLEAQPSGQQSFPLTPVAANKFDFSAAGIEMEFVTEKNAMFFKQHGLTYIFVRDGK